MGERFGHYEIMRRLAAGGMAEVLLAKQTSLGGFERLVCLKRILAHLGGQEEFLRMFMDEARIAANLIHPNVAQIYDISQEGGQYYIAMEYVRGEDLRRVYNQEVGAGNAIPKHIAALIIMGAAAGLDYAHRQTNLQGAPLGIVHRDVSPQNILVTYDGHVKLIDFGVAKAAGKLNQTRAGVLKGKYSYMSPEQASGDPLDGRTDIFALGITLYEITTGTRLFKRDNELETLHAVIACNVKPPREVVPNYDEDLERIVLRALAYDVDSRYTTAGELEHDLERYLLHRGHPTSATSLAGYMQELFADKLSDEALFGGPPWQEAATKSRQAHGGAAVVQAGPKTDASATDGESPDVADVLGTRVSAPGEDPTVVDASPYAQSAEGHKEPSGTRGLTPAEWRQAPERPEQTAPTHSQSSANSSDVTVVPDAAAEAPPEAQAMQPPETRPTAPTPLGAAPPRRVGRRLAALSLALAATAALGLQLRALRQRARAQAAASAVQHAPPEAAAAHAQGAPPQELRLLATPAADDAAEPPVRLPPTGTTGGLLDIDAPVPMTVWLGAQYLGTTPLKNVRLPSGTLLLKLENRRDGGTVMRTVRLRPKKHERLTVGPARGTLDVTADPWAWLQMGLHPAQETPAHLELYEGEYVLTTECPDGLRRQETVRVNAAWPARVVVRCSSAR